MEPFGPDNSAPVFLAKKVYFKYPPKILKDKHLKITVFQHGNNAIFEAIGFGMAQYLDEISPNNGVNIAFSIETNEYLGVRNIQLRLRDIKTDNYGA